MEHVRKLIEECRTKLGVETDYQLAKAMDLHRGTLSQCISGKRPPDAYTCARIALVLELDPLEIIASIEAERARTPERRAFWQDLGKSSRKVAATVAALLFFVFSTIAPQGCDANGCRRFFRNQKYA